MKTLRDSRKVIILEDAEKTAEFAAIKFIEIAESSIKRTFYCRPVRRENADFPLPKPGRASKTNCLGQDTHLYC
jgi:hypothetical protein